jgi:hypothetical protein
LPHARRDGGPLLRSLLQDNADGPKKPAVHFALRV